MPETLEISVRRVVDRLANKRNVPDAGMNPPSSSRFPAIVIPDYAFKVERRLVIAFWLFQASHNGAANRRRVRQDARSPAANHCITWAPHQGHAPIKFSSPGLVPKSHPRARRRIPE